MTIKNGTNNNDNLVGSDNSDKLYGSAGDDTLYGYNSDDVLRGGAGNDVLDGGQGADIMIGGIGNDWYVVDNIGDVVSETSNPKGQIDGVETYIDNYVLGRNVENLQLGYGSVIIQGTGNALNNGLWGNDADNILMGLAGNDQLRGGVGNDSLYGSAGNDELDGGTGIDTLIGGTGKDTYWVDDSADVLIETTVSTAPTEADSVFTTVDYTLPANVENLSLLSPTDWRNSTALNGVGNESANTLTGNELNNHLQGLGGNDNLIGGAGDDNLEGGTGNDTLNGGTGADTLRGEAGNDYYLVDNSADSVIETANNGIDTVESWLADYTLTAEVENLVLLQENWQINNIPQNALGNNLANRLQGNGSDNHLSGAAGNDVLIGAGGNDVLNGGLGNDILQGGANWENDIFVFDSALNAASNVDQIVDFSGSKIIQLNHNIFSALNSTTGLTADMLVSGDNMSKAQDANDFIIYNNSTGAVYYDADGNGTNSQPIQFIGMGAGLNLVASEFAVI